MTRKDMDIAINWARIEGWNPGLHDAECFYSADSNGFFIAELAGEPLGCISAVAYDDYFGFAGLYIVRPEFRGKGVGKQLVQKASAYMGERIIGNDGVVAQQDNYRRMGFRLAYRNVRYKGIAPIAAVADMNTINLREWSFEDLLAYDRRMFPAARPDFLRYWIRQEDSSSLGFIQDGHLAGYGVIRKCHEGYKIGPLFADKLEIASALFLALSTKVAGEEIYLDIPDPNPDALALVKEHDMQMVFETARMYKGEIPDLPLQQIFGVTTFELG